jgi:hypothetical protein
MMAARWLRKRLPFLLCSTILLGVNCPPLVVDSFKTGITRWVTGAFSTIDLTPYTDLVIDEFAGDPSPGV